MECPVEKLATMLSDAVAQHPSGLPDTELQLVLERHLAWLSVHAPDLQRRVAGHLAVYNQRTAGSRPLHLQLVSGDRS